MRETLRKAFEQSQFNKKPRPEKGSFEELGFKADPETTKAIDEAVGNGSPEDMLRVMDEMGLISMEVKKASVAIRALVEAVNGEGKPGAPRVAIMQTVRKSDGKSVGVVCLTESDGGEQELRPILQAVVDSDDYFIPPTMERRKEED